MIFGTTFSYTARVHTFKKNVEAGRKRQELSFFGGDGINRPDLIVHKTKLVNPHVLSRKFL